MILRPQLEPTDHQSVLDYYLANYSEVHIVTCNKCGNDLAIEIRGEVSGYKANEFGFTVLPFGDNLLSSRFRTDGSMGYQCGVIVPNPAYPKAKAEAEANKKKALADYELQYKQAVKSTPKGADKPEYAPPAIDIPVHEPETIRCDNDTRGTEIEEELSPTGTFLPHEVHAIQQKQIRIGWKPKIKQVGNKQIHETFTRERIK